jgi:hypothetical protein
LFASQAKKKIVDFAFNPFNDHVSLLECSAGRVAGSFVLAPAVDRHLPAGRCRCGKFAPDSSLFVCLRLNPVLGTVCDAQLWQLPKGGQTEHLNNPLVRLMPRS